MQIFENDVWKLNAGTYKGIYVYKLLPNAKNPNPSQTLRKVGEFTIHADEYVEYSQQELNDLAFNNRITDYTTTGGDSVEIVFTAIAIDKHGHGFRDYKVHELLRREGYHATKLEGNNATEWFEAPDSLIQQIIWDHLGINGSTETNADSANGESSIVLRPEQSEAVTMAKKRYYRAKKKGVAGKTLLNAKMRYGKTLVAYSFTKEVEAETIGVITHRPSTITSWLEEATKVYDEPIQFVSREPIKGMKTVSWENRDKNKKTIIFLSLQDARQKEERVNNTKVSDKEKAEQTDDTDTIGFKKRNAEIFNETEFDVLIVDESHEGTETVLAQDVFNAIKTQFTLYLSGTDFRRIQSDDFAENEIFNWTYVDEQRAKRNHYIDYPDKKNPYHLLPSISWVGTEVDQTDKDKEEYGLLTKNAMFSVNKFLELNKNTFTVDDPTSAEFNVTGQKNLRRYLRKLGGFNTFDGQDEDERIEDTVSNTFAPFGTQMDTVNRHSLWVVDSVATAHALEKELNRHIVFKNKKTINIAGDIKVNSGGQYKNSEAEQWVKDTIGSDFYSNESSTITITCGRLTVGASIPAWSAVIFLSDMTSPSSYLQTAFRCQTPCEKFMTDETGNVLPKTNVRVYDPVPDRTLAAITETVAPSYDSPESEEQDRTSDAISEFLNFSPVMSFHGNKNITMNTDDFMKTMNRVYSAQVVNDKFISPRMYNQYAELSDEIVDALELMNKRYGTLSKKGRNEKVSINETGLGEAERKEIEKKPEKERNSHEKNALDEEKKKRKSVAAILNTLSARIPLLAAFNYLQIAINGENKVIEITPDNLTDLIDDESWSEFMPKDFSKDEWNKIKGIYNREIFKQSIGIIVSRMEYIYSLPIDQYLIAIEGVFEQFADPDKETILTPARVVNLQMSQAFGGMRTVDTDGNFYVKNLITNEESAKDFWSVFGDPDYEFSPQWLGTSDNLITQGEDESYWADDKNTFIDLNSKTALYPLYATRSMYYAKKKQLADSGVVLTENIKMAVYRDVVENNIYVNTRVPYSRTIFNRVIAGKNNDWKTNASVVDVANMFKEVIRPYARTKKNKFDVDFADDVIAYVFDRENFGDIASRAEKVMKIKNTNELEEIIEHSKNRLAKSFNAVIGNPPYQVDAGGKRHQVYADFYLSARSISKKYVSLIFPLGWQKSTGRASGSVLHPRMRKDKAIVSVDNYYEEKDGNIQLFPDAGTGGVSIVFADDSETTDTVKLYEYNELIDDKKDLTIISDYSEQTQVIFDNMVTWMQENSLNSIKNKISGRNPFGIQTYVVDETRKEWESVSEKEKKGYIKFFASKGRSFWIPKNFKDQSGNTLNLNNIDKANFAWSYTGAYSSWRTVRVIGKNEAATESFLIANLKENEIEGFYSYFLTYFYRFLISERADSHNAMKTVHEFVPDIAKITNPRTNKVGYESDWTDDDLRTVFADVLTDDDWRHIKATAIANDNGRGDYEAGYELPKPFSWDEVFPDNEWNGKKHSLTLD